MDNNTILGYPYGYSGKMLDINLTTKCCKDLKISNDFMDMYIGGTGFGVKILYDRVKPGISWDNPENVIIISSGPLGGSRVSGSGLISIVTKGAMTKHIGTTQANGFFGAYLRFNGYDGLIISGRSDDLSAIIIEEGQGKIEIAKELSGLDTWQVEEKIRSSKKFNRRSSIFSIGPAGEKMVRYAVVVGDHGHVASKNGVGAVFGAKNLKAIVAVNADHKIPTAYPEDLKGLAAKALKMAKNHRGGVINKFGTMGIVKNIHSQGLLPVKNFTTNIMPEHENISGQTLHKEKKLKRKPCFACGLGHLHYVTFPDGPYKGLTIEEPEYECIVAMGSLIGLTDLDSVLMLSDKVDRAGIDANETGWTIAWAIECYLNGILSKNDLDGIELKWGDAKSVGKLIDKIVNRDGIGNLLAEGVMRASQKIGGDAENCGIFTLKGATPRGHDHRARWAEMLDTCVSNTSTLEAQAMGGALPEIYGMPAVKDSFDPNEVGKTNALVNGYRIFEDCLGVCYFNTVEPSIAVDLYNAQTGKDINLDRAMWIGKRIVHLMRLFNLRHGIDIRLEKPSSRYGSKIQDGPCEGKEINPVWDQIKKNYYIKMGWDVDTGWPLPGTLDKFDLSKYSDALPEELKKSKQ